MKSKRNIKENIIRGCNLFVFVYVLNLIRFTLPLLIIGEPYISEHEALSLSMAVDIFQLAGLSLIFSRF